MDAVYETYFGETVGVFARMVYETEFVGCAGGIDYLI
jgi:hypothetical protein